MLSFVEVSHGTDVGTALRMKPVAQPTLIFLLLALPFTGACGTMLLRTGSPTFRARVHLDATPRARATATRAGSIQTAGAGTTETGGASIDHGHRHHEESATVRVVDHGQAGGHEVVPVPTSGAGGSAGHVEVVAHGAAEGAEVVEAGDTALGSPTDRPGSMAHVVAGGPVTLDTSAAGLAPAPTGRGPGVRGITGGAPHLGALLEGGLDVDGTVLRFADVGPLELSGGAEVDGRFLGATALEAFLTIEHDMLPRDGGETRVTVRVRGAAASERRSPVDIHLVLDRSSSMQGSWGEAVVAAKELIRGMAPTDRIHIVAYGTRGEEVVSPRLVGDGAQVRRALDRIRVGGGTNIEAGLDIAYRAVRRAPPRFHGRSLVILVSDGVPNEGELGAAGLSAMTKAVRTDRACKTTVIGLGDQFDVDILGTIAQEGRGGYYLARTARELAPALAAELRAHGRVAARDVEVSLDLGPETTIVDVFDGQAGTELSGHRVTLTLPSIAAGEERRIVVRVRVAPGAQPRAVASARVRYRAGGAQRSASGEAWLGFGASARSAAGAGSWHAVEADLGRALAYAGRQVRYGNGELAAERLRAHVRIARRHPARQRGSRLGHRTAAVGRLATALGSVTARATHQERRQVGLSLGALSVRFAR